MWNELRNQDPGSNLGSEWGKLRYPGKLLHTLPKWSTNKQKQCQQYSNLLPTFENFEAASRNSWIN